MAKKKKCVILYRTHIWPFKQSLKGMDLQAILIELHRGVNEYNERKDRKFDYELCILFNEAGNVNILNRDSYNCDYHSFTHQDIRAAGFLTNDCEEFKAIFSKVDLHKRAERFLKGKPFWFSGEYGILDYYLKRDECAYYWNVEYDCWPVGNFSEYLRCFDNKTEDLLTSRYQRKGLPGDWHPWYDIIAGFEPEHRYGCYFPFFRLSNKAVKTLVRGYLDERVVGYCEGLVPTYLNHKGLSCANFSRYYKQYSKRCTMRHNHHGNIVHVG